MTRDLPKHEPYTWWWHREPDGRYTLYPRMTLEKLDPLPITDATLFRCVRCKAEGTNAALTAMSCTDIEWYHGDIREYRRTFTPMRCTECKNEWIIPTGIAHLTKCSACGSASTEEIPS